VTAAAGTQPGEERGEEGRVGRLRAVIESQPLNAIGENSDFVNGAGFHFAKNFLSGVRVRQKVGRVGVLALLRPANDGVTIRFIAPRFDNRAVSDLEIDCAIAPNDRSQQRASEILYPGALGARPTGHELTEFSDPVREEIIR